MWIGQDWGFGMSHGSLVLAAGHLVSLRVSPEFNLAQSRDTSLASLQSSLRWLMILGMKAADTQFDAFGVLFRVRVKLRTHIFHMFAGNAWLGRMEWNHGFVSCLKAT